MSWTGTNIKSVDGVLDGFPYSIQITWVPPESTDTTDIKNCWDLTQTYTVYRGIPILETINMNNIKFWITLNYFELMGMPKPSAIMKDITIPGAFRGCSNLTSVTIPRSVKYIDYFAFWNTGLTSVTIAQDCVYQDSSFPTGCVINRYS